MIHSNSAEIIGTEQDVIEAYGNLQNCPYRCTLLSSGNPKGDTSKLLSFCKEYLKQLRVTNTHAGSSDPSDPISQNDDLLSISSGDSSIFDTKDTCCNSPKKCIKPCQKWQRPIPGFYDKLILIQTKIDSILYDININLFNPMRDPENRAEADKRFAKENEFLTRFIRNYLCEFTRQMRELMRLIDVKYKNQIIVDSIYQKVLTMHQVVKLSLQVYAKYMPLRMHYGIHTKVKEVLDGLMKLTDICIENELFADVFGIKLKVNNMLITINDAPLVPVKKNKNKQKYFKLHHLLPPRRRYDMYKIFDIEGKEKWKKSSVNLRKFNKTKSFKIGQM